MTARSDEPDMENRSPPPMRTIREGDPVAADKHDVEKLSAANQVIPRSLASVAANFNGNCQGQDVYANNCAHYLSDAFIGAGFSQLTSPNDCVSARCGSAAKRVWDGLLEA